MKQKTGSPLNDDWLLPTDCILVRMQVHGKAGQPYIASYTTFTLKGWPDAADMWWREHIKPGIDEMVAKIKERDGEPKRNGTTGR